MSNETEVLSSLLSGMVDSGTFTKDALKRMQDALANAKTLEKDVETKNNELKTLRYNNVTQANEIDGFRKAEATLADREKVLVVREAKITTLEKDAAVARAQADTVSGCFEKVFRNFTINKSVNGSVPIAGIAGTYPTTHPTYENETVTVS